MYNSERFIELIKSIALDVQESTYPVQLVYGTVVSADPLKVRISQQVILSGTQLLRTSTVADRTVRVELALDDSVMDAGLSPVDTLEGELTIKNGLTVGEIVLLLRMQGGQRFLILDRVVNG